MDDLSLSEPVPTEPPKKPPRKPRPSEIAAKKAKAEAAKKKVSKKRAKPKTKKPAKKKTVKKKKTGAKRGRKPVDPAIARSERIDMRVTKAEKKRIVAKAKKLDRTVTSLLYEAVEKIK